MDFQSDYTLSGVDIYRSRIHQVVILHRKEGGLEGIFRCSIPDENGESNDLYVGIYRSSTATGNVVIYNYVHDISKRLSAGSQYSC